MLKQVLFKKWSFQNSTEAFCIKRNNLCPFLGKKNWVVSEVLVILTAWNGWPCSVLRNWKHGNFHCCSYFICITRNRRFAHKIHNIGQQKVGLWSIWSSADILLCTYCIALSTNELNNRITTHPVAGNISFFLRSVSIYKMDIKLLLSL